MKEKIHPKYNECKISCACGNAFVGGSVQKELKVDVCSASHPFYTGQQRQSAARGRVERFNKRYGKDAQ